MYLILIAWLYVTLMMAIAEATNPIGSALGGIVTFVLYGVLPMVIVAYLLATPQRKRKLKARRQAEQDAWDAAQQCAVTAAQAGSAPSPQSEAMAVGADAPAASAPANPPDTTATQPSQR